MPRSKISRRAIAAGLLLAAPAAALAAKRGDPRSSMMTRDLSRATPEAAGFSAAGLARIDAALQGYIDRGEIAGCITLAARHGKLAHVNALGLKDIATREPLAADTIFRIYSMTKPVTAAAMMILHDEGRWSADDPIAKHLPAFEAVKVFAGLDAAGAPRLASPRHAPTLGELLSQTAGLSYGFLTEEPIDKLYQAANVMRSGSLEEMAGKIAALPLAYQPGSQWRYGLSLDVAGALIEKLSGQSLAEFMQARLFGPLGMVDTGFHVPAEKRARLATLYRHTPTGLVPQPPMMPDYPSPMAIASGGAGLVSTAADYARFAQMLLNGGEWAGRRIVSRKALALQMGNHLAPVLISGGFGVGHAQLRPGFGYGWGGAVFTDPKAAGVPVGRGTYQWDGAFGTWFWVDPENDLTFIGLIQRGPGDYPPLQEMTQKLLADAIV